MSPQIEGPDAKLRLRPAGARTHGPGHAAPSAFEFSGFPGCPPPPTPLGSSRRQKVAPPPSLVPPAPHPPRARLGPSAPRPLAGAQAPCERPAFSDQHAPRPSGAPSPSLPTGREAAPVPSDKRWSGGSCGWRRSPGGGGTRRHLRGAACSALDCEISLSSVRRPPVTSAVVTDTADENDLLGFGVQEERPAGSSLRRRAKTRRNWRVSSRFSLQEVFCF